MLWLPAISRAQNIPAVLRRAWISGYACLTCASTSRSESTAGLIPVARKGPTSAVTSSDFSGSLVAGRQAWSKVSRARPRICSIVVFFAECNPGLIPAGIGIVCVGFMRDPPGSGDVPRIDGIIAAPEVGPAGEDACGADLDCAILMS